MTLSIVSPVYQAENVLEELLYRIQEAVVKITSTYEIMLVENGSPDNSWQKIKELSKKYPVKMGIAMIGFLFAAYTLFGWSLAASDVL
ncbi:glycosyl transferase family 2 [Algoriphagus boseongensis]|uniref:Glycosyl transferase family 2 n=1 Tax=Algoriphagus boseongensis TaxID=1442587 RepID=A0A4R6T947_9BACT|nr:glycosyltransferase [Algoriphagus boseongensis]TDQ19590.1 glycosyl transferase family 2 [Algoriphagus boseongensis]